MSLSGRFFECALKKSVSLFLRALFFSAVPQVDLLVQGLPPWPKRALSSPLHAFNQKVAGRPGKKGLFHLVVGVF